MFKSIAVVLLMFSLSVSAEVPDKVGMVILSLGKNFAQQPNTSSRALKRKSEIFNQDTVTTGAEGRLQLRFTDGSRLAIGKNSEFLIDKFQYSENKPENGKSVYKLLKGSLRTITGAISKADPANYELQTPIATIGVRGTDFIVALCDQKCARDGQVEQGLYGYVIEGEIVITDKDMATNSVVEGHYFNLNLSSQIKISKQPLSAFEFMQGLNQENMIKQEIEPNIPAMDIQKGPKLKQLINPLGNGEVGSPESQ
jgi:hypothetical protein